MDDRGPTEQELGAAALRDGRGRTRLRASALAELGQASLSGRDVSDVMHRACEMLCALLEVDYAKVLERSAERNGAFVLVAGHGWGPGVVVGETTVPASAGSQAGYTMASETAVVVTDLSTETRFSVPDLLVAHNVVSGMSAVVSDAAGPRGVLGVHSRRARTFAEDDIDFLRLVAAIVGSALQQDRVRRELAEQSAARERRARYHAAIAESAASLLASRGEGRIDRALSALLDATEAAYVFLERNVDDPELGLCSQTVAEVEAEPGGPELENDYWDKVPWSQMPISRSHLERGEPFVVIPEELVGVERELYDADPYPIKSELDIPIFVDGAWAGLIGFADATTVRDWSRGDLALLTAAATMIGAFWEREAARDELHSLIASKDELVASVSHELRTPLTSVLGLSQELSAGIDAFTSSEIREFAQLIAGQSTEMAYLIDDLLVAARVDIGRITAHPEMVDLRQELDDTVQTLWAGRAVPVVGEAIAWADPHRVRQIVRNLLTNAARYGGSRVRAEVLRNGSSSMLRILDDGPGVHRDYRDRIFHPFERAEDHSGLTQSIGLGLTVSRQLAQLMDGDLEYARSGEWTMFTLRLPAAEPGAAGT